MTCLFRSLLRFIPLFLLAACATALPRPGIDYQPGRVVETLSSSVSVSIHTATTMMGGHGFLVYRRPDQLHLVILSPFGTTLMEAFALGERVTLVYPGRSVAYSGLITELPDKDGLQGWSMMRWVMDADPPGDGLVNGTVERVTTQGVRERVTVENGLVTAKVSAAGDKVYYSNYTVINGVPLATEIDLRNARDDRILLNLSEPEVNIRLDDAALLPRLTDMTVLPLSAIKGM
ncbi:MAG TPA: hypothetical protein VIH45_04290 [Desulfuromonadaceae bacterium]